MARSADERANVHWLDGAFDVARLPPICLMPDSLIAGGVNLYGDEREWVRQSEHISFRPLMFDVGQGYYINIVRVSRSGIFSRHRNTGPVHAFTLRGEWKCLESEWSAEAGDYIFEPPGQHHTLVVPEEASEMAALFHVTGGEVYTDPFGSVLGYEDVFTKLELAARHYQHVGLGSGFVQRLIR
jgi:quercetin dioxygenase-like cupin family protein